MDRKEERFWYRDSVEKSGMFRTSSHLRSSSGTLPSGRAPDSATDCAQSSTSSVFRSYKNCWCWAYSLGKESIFSTTPSASRAARSSSSWIRSCGSICRAPVKSHAAIRVRGVAAAPFRYDNSAYIPRKPRGQCPTAAYPPRQGRRQRLPCAPLFSKFLPLRGRAGKGPVRHSAPPSGSLRG